MILLEFQDVFKAAESLNCYLISVRKWDPQWPVKFSPEKTLNIVCRHKDRAIELMLFFDYAKLHTVTSHHHFGIILWKYKNKFLLANVTTSIQ